MAMDVRYAHYLDAMGIQLWQRRDAVPVIANDIAEPVAPAQPEISVQSRDSEDAQISRLDWKELQACVAQCPRCPELVVIVAAGRLLTSSEGLLLLHKDDLRQRIA